MKRRLLLKAAGAAVIGVSALLSLSFLKQPALAQLNKRLNRWYERTVENTIPNILEDEYTLEVTGSVSNSFTLTYKELEQLPRIRFTKDFNCVEGWTVPQIKWEGISLRTLIDIASPSKDAKYLNIYSFGDTYRESITFAEAMEIDNILVLKADNKKLEPKHGFPVRLFMPGKYAYKSAKWVHKIEFSDTRAGSYWNDRGYDIDAAV